MEVSSSQVPGRVSALDYCMTGEASGRELLLGAGYVEKQSVVSVQQNRTSSAFWMMVLCLDTANFMSLGPSSRHGPEK